MAVRGALAAAVALVVTATASGTAGALSAPQRPSLDGAATPVAQLDDDLDVAAYVLVDPASGQVLAAHNEHEPRPVASTIKILTALSVAERADLDDTVTIGSEVVGIGGADVGLSPGDVWHVRELLDALVALSGNDAAEALARHVGGTREAFLAAMAHDVAALGLGQRTIATPSGLSNDARLSAHDLAVIATAALHHPDLEGVFARSTVTTPAGELRSRNFLLDEYPGATGVKTGYTAAAGWCLVGSAVRDGRELVAVVLGATSERSRLDAVSRLLDHGFVATRTVTLGTRLDLAQAGGVALYEVSTVVTIPAHARVELATPALAGIVAGTTATFEILVDGTPRGRVQADPSVPDREPPEGDAHVGAALVDATYGALRAAAAAGVLG